jgi:hypothetical protein
VTCAGELVASHPRSWARHRTITDPDHDLARKALRATRAGLGPIAGDDQVEQRDLAVYDQATGVA